MLSHFVMHDSLLSVPDTMTVTTTMMMMMTLKYNLIFDQTSVSQ